MNNLGLHPADFVNESSGAPRALSHYFNTSPHVLPSNVHTRRRIGSNTFAGLFKEPHILKGSYYCTLWFPLCENVFILTRDLEIPSGEYYYHNIIYRKGGITSVEMATSVKP
jgi:hypothetical protein